MGLKKIKEIVLPRRQDKCIKIDIANALLAILQFHNAKHVWNKLYINYGTSAQSNDSENYKNLAKFLNLKRKVPDVVNFRLYKHKFDKYVDIQVKMSMVWLKSFMIGYFLNTDFDITYENYVCQMMRYMKSC